MAVVTRVLPAFVVALLAVAPSAMGVLVDAAEKQYCATRGGFARSGADSGGRERTIAQFGGFGRERLQTLLYAAPVVARIGLPVAHPRAREVGALDRVVDGRALARRTFATQRRSAHASDDPDAAA